MGSKWLKKRGQPGLTFHPNEKSQAISGDLPMARFGLLGLFGLRAHPPLMTTAGGTGGAPAA